MASLWRIQEHSWSEQFVIGRSRHKTGQNETEAQRCEIRNTVVTPEVFGYDAFYRLADHKHPECHFCFFCFLILTKVTVHLHGFQRACAEGVVLNKHRWAPGAVPALKALDRPVYWQQSMLARSSDGAPEGARIWLAQPWQAAWTESARVCRLFYIRGPIAASDHMETGRRTRVCENLEWNMI